MLFRSLVVGPFRCSLVSIHAPDSSSPQFDEWWDDFGSVWDVATCNSPHVLCGADLNYSFGRHDVQPCFGNENIIVEPGTLLWFNNKVPHGTVNIADEERITFVFDVLHSPDNPQHNIDGQS